MDILKKALAPLTDEAWKEINEQAGRIFKSYQTARKFVDIEGPKGIEYSAVPAGRLAVPEQETTDGVNLGIRQVMPLIEIRKPFHLDMWEMDNISRGAKDPDLSSLEEAAKAMALFEEKTIYQGFEKAGIQGLANSSGHEPVSLPDNPNEVLKVVAEQVSSLQREAVEGPYSLIINSELWKKLVSLAQGYPILRQLRDILNGEVIVNHSAGDSFLVSKRGGDYELVIGQDAAVGYDGHDQDQVKLFFTESFTFRVLSPEALIVLK